MATEQEGARKGGGEGELADNRHKGGAARQPAAHSAGVADWQHP
jgi:hypothetical protein